MSAEAGGFGLCPDRGSPRGPGRTRGPSSVFSTLAMRASGPRSSWQGPARRLTPSDRHRAGWDGVGGLAVDEDDQALGTDDGGPHRGDARRAAVGEIEAGSTARVGEALEFCELGHGHLHCQHQQESDKRCPRYPMGSAWPRVRRRATGMTESQQQQGAGQ